MLCIDNNKTDVYFNLASEEYLLKYSSENIFMLWQNEPSVIVGKHQDVYEEVNIDFANTNNIKIARRFSGGGAVYHDYGNLNLTFIETSSLPDFGIFSQRIINMLASLGIKASSDERRALTVDGLKISGSAQSIHKDRVLFHATLLFSSDLNRLITSLESTPEQKKEKPKRKVSVRSVKSPVTNLSEHLPASVGMDEIRKLIMNYYISQDTNNKFYTFSNEDIQVIEKLKETKYATLTWIFNAEFLKKQSL